MAVLPRCCYCVQAMRAWLMHYHQGQTVCAFQHHVAKRVASNVLAALQENAAAESHLKQHAEVCWPL